MTAAVHYQERITATTSTTSGTFVTKLTLAAAELSTAGFSTNDDVIIFAWVRPDTTNTDSWPRWQVTYNGTALNVIGFEQDAVTAGSHTRASLVMFKVDLGATITDIDLDLLSDGGSSVSIDEATLTVVKYADFGTDNTDVHWDESTTALVHTTTPAATNQASITATFTAEDWVVFACSETTIDDVAINHRMRINLDSGTILGPSRLTEEGEDTIDQKVWTIFDVVTLSAAEHTFEIEVSDDGSGTQNDTIRTALLIFRKDVWEDLYIGVGGDVAVNDDTETQVATVTDTLSTTQDLLVFGEAAPDIGAEKDLYMWVEQDAGGPEIVEPTDTYNWPSAYSHDATDEPLLQWFGFIEAESSVLDLDLYVWQNSGGAITFYDSNILIWGMELATSGQTLTPTLVSQLLAGVDPALTTGNVNLAPDPESQLAAGVDPTVTSNVNVAPTLETQLLAGVDPAVTTGNVNLSPALESQLLTAVDPALSVDMKPALETQLLAGVDPTLTAGNVNLSPALESQLLAGVDPALTTGNVNLAPALESQLLAGVDPAVTQDSLILTPALESQLLTGVDPTVTTGNVNLAPDLVTQLLAGVAPGLSLQLTFTLVTQLFTGVDPTVTAGNVDISPALESQLLTGVDPTVTTGNVDVAPEIVLQLVAGVDPAVGGGEHSLAPGFDIARFYRHNISGSERLVLVVGTPRSVGKGFRADESWDTISGHFALPAEPRHPAAKQEAIGQVITAWTENKTDTQTVLTAAINAALTTAGYTRAQGAPIT